jgi:hypothetical protein
VPPANFRISYPSPFEFAQQAQAVAYGIVVQQAAAAALQAEVQSLLNQINTQLAALGDQLAADENELSTLLGDLNQAQECSAPSSQVQCPSLSAAQLVLLSQKVAV